MRSPLPFPCVPDRPYKILLVQVGTLSFSHPSFGVPVLFIYLCEQDPHEVGDAMEMDIGAPSPPPEEQSHDSHSGARPTPPQLPSSWRERV